MMEAIMGAVFMKDYTIKNVINLLFTFDFHYI